MTGPVAVGIPGLSLAPGDHVCGFYSGTDERDAILLPFLREGLHAGDKCVCILDGTDPNQLRSALDVDEVDGPGPELDLRCSLDTYFTSGAFSAERMLAFWMRLLADATAGGSPLVRIICEMSWALRDLPGVEELIAYESEYNRYADRYPQVVICMYDLDRFGGAILMDILKTHPKVMASGMIYDNPYYIEPAEFLATRR
ncbi:MEDS domain-containing protein [Pseudonocardia asaccharolytica]|uniref:MEDS domain-containing protein n=1 Tax=Pseudonocardia asaccharolytica DSM 44247 = NBRC 16224 TaxID=1123024 RepID=A0A511D3T2_9PSEU|nr:MEDS domain-containing protein [Pseudonocardia asaccharolytica]GEL19442.1 hypothetical protein PA7_32790 [Pseudonocardia asaccharolytica DSM 44247 = NBRC 16224]